MDPLSANKDSFKLSFAVDANTDRDVFSESPYTATDSNGPEQTELSIFDVLCARDDGVKILGAYPEDKLSHVSTSVATTLAVDWI